MASLLEHSDHRKAGRALAIVSASYILLGQCSAGFNSAGILGLNVQLTQEDLHRIFGYLIWVYLVIFLVRSIPNIGFDRLYKFQADRESQRQEVFQSVSNVEHDKRAGAEIFINQYRKKLPDEKLLREAVITHNKKKLGYLDWQEKRRSYYGEKFKFLGYTDFILLYVTEFIPPLVFFAATWYNLQPMICPSFTG